MSNTTRRMMPLFKDQQVTTKTATNGQKICHIPNQRAPDHIKPLSFLISDERNLVENHWVNRVAKHIQNYQHQLPTIKNLIPSLRRILIGKVS